MLFGTRPQRFLQQSGIRAVCYTGTERDYATRADEDLRGSMVPLGTTTRDLAEAGMRGGLRYARNQTLVNIMRDYGYVAARGMGVRNKIIPGMRRHNGTEPELLAEEHRFIVRLLKEPARHGSSP